MKEIGHYIDASTSRGKSGRFADVFNPATGEVQARVALATESELAAAVGQRQGRPAGLGCDQPAARARVCMKFVDPQPEHGRDRRNAVARA